MLLNGALGSVSELFSLAVVNIWLLAGKESLLTKPVGLAVPQGIRDWKEGGGRIAGLGAKMLR